MHLSLQLWLIDNFSKPGETILDPMAGSGTILVACSMGRNVITVELEEKFVQMQKGNWQKIQQRGCQLGYSMGKATILQGDARELKGLFTLSKAEGLVDKCIFSPAYGNNPGTPSLGSVNKDDWGKEGTDIVKRRGLEKGYSNNPNNLGNLPYGEMDSLRSPQVDKIITSPPYVEAQATTDDDYVNRHITGGKLATHHVSADNLGNLPYGQVDAVISSPPYENQGQGQGKEYHPERMVGSETGLGRGYSEAPANIGNLKGDTYLSAMLQVYQQCYQVLKPSHKVCGCDIISAKEGTNGQALSSGIFRRRGLRGVDREGGEIDSRSEIKRSAETNQGLLGEPGLSGDISLSPEIQIQSQNGGAGDGISYSGSELSEHQDYSQRPDAIPDSKERGCNQDNSGDRQEASEYREAKRKGCDDVERTRFVVNQNREVLPLLKPQDSQDIPRQRSSENPEICPRCHQQIRYEGGLLVLVTKNFIRNKQQVDLAGDTIKLCEQAGFTYQDRWYRELANQSFWRTIYYQKFPEVEPIKFEDVLVFRK